MCYVSIPKLIICQAINSTVIPPKSNTLLDGKANCRFQYVSTSSFSHPYSKLLGNGQRNDGSSIARCQLIAWNGSRQKMFLQFNLQRPTKFSFPGIENRSSDFLNALYLAIDRSQNSCPHNSPFFHSPDIFQWLRMNGVTFLQLSPCKFGYTQTRGVPHPLQA